MHDSTDALARAYLEHRGYVRGCLRRAGLATDALDDAVHDVFAVLVRRRDDVDERWSIRQYLAGIARHVAANHRRRARRPDPGVLVQWGHAVPSMPELQLDLTRELGGLAPQHRDAVLQCDREGCTAAEIAHAQNLPLTTVQWRLRCAHQRLRTLLDCWRDAAAAVLAIDLRRLVAPRVLVGGLATALAAVAIVALPPAQAPEPTPASIVEAAVAAPAHAARSAPAAPLPLALALPTDAPDARDGTVRLGVPRVEPDPVAPAPVRPRARPPRRRAVHRAAAPLFPDGAIYFVMDDLHVPKRRRS